MNIIWAVEGNSVIVVDDIIDAAGKKKITADGLTKKGAVELYGCTTHPVLSGPELERIEDSQIKELVVTNTIDLPEEKKISQLTQLSVASLLGEAITRIHENKSVSVLFD